MNNNWTIDQTRRLFELCAAAKAQGKSLSCAFRTVADETHRSLNSVRNYYYGQAKTFELVPEVAQKLGIKNAEVERERFVPFAAEEVTALVRSVLVATGAGKSVRRAIFELANDDAKTALRLQNKYRSVLRSHREIVEDIMRKLDADGIAYRNPYGATNADNFARLTEYIAALDNKRVGKFLEIIQKLAAE